MRRVLGIAGWSGSGKTTLLEALVRELRAEGLAVAVLKHDAHGLDGGDARRDSERLHAAGATVVALGPGEGLARWRAPREALVAGGDAARAGDELLPWLGELERRHDLVLVEGWKRAALPKLWLLAEGESAPPPEVVEVLATLPRDATRLGAARTAVRERLLQAWQRAPRRAGVLAGGRGVRMGQPKHALRLGGETLLARTARALAAVGPVLLLGEPLAPAEPPLPALPDVPGVRGPLAGLLAALRWAPATWVVAACDLPRLRADAVAWLLAQRAPGRWAVLPRLAGEVQPLLAVYEPQALPLLEALAARDPCAGPRLLAADPRVWTPDLPPEIADAWRGANTPEELAALTGGG